MFGLNAIALNVKVFTYCVKRSYELKVQNPTVPDDVIQAQCYVDLANHLIKTGDIFKLNAKRQKNLMAIRNHGPIANHEALLKMCVKAAMYESMYNHASQNPDSIN